MSKRLLPTAVAILALAAPALVCLVKAPRLRAQAPQAAVPQAAAANPEFEVASIKINKSGDGRVMVQNQPGGRFTATNVTLRMLIRQAYQLQDFQISGGPSWLNDDHFDVVAKADPSALGGGTGGPAFGAPDSGPTPTQLMIRALLADRFKLTVHHDNKELPVYALVVARSDGKLGSALKKSDVDCAAMIAAARGRGRGPMAPPAPGERMPCGFRVGMGTMTAGGATLAQLATSLSMFVGRVVVDKTGITGGYDFDLTWTPDQMPQRPPGAPDPVFNGVAIDPNGPSIFTAVQEQLGLKLDSQKGPVAVLVIDRAEHPVEN
jgi:uncharacterized protein (TIGR03435 family)